MIPMETARDWNCVDEKTQLPQSFAPLMEHKLHDLTITILSWIRGNNLHNTQQPQALTYVQETGLDFVSFEFKLHGDIVTKRRPRSHTYRLAKVICFDQDRTKIRVRYTVWRFLQDPEDILGNRIVKQLLDLVEVDYSLNMHPGLGNAKRVAVDIYNHIGDGMFDFEDYRDHPDREPPIVGVHGFNAARLKRPQ